MITHKPLIVARVTRGWSRSQVSTRLGIHPTTYRKWEKRHNHPTPAHVYALCALFGLTASELGLTLREVPPVVERVHLPPCPLTRETNEHMRALRHAHGWSQVETAARLGISKNAYEHFEIGNTIPSLKMLWNLCCLFNRTPDDLGYPIYHPPAETPDPQLCCREVAPIVPPSTTPSEPFSPT